jgi:hypothetical protein
MIMRQDEGRCIRHNSGSEYFASVDQDGVHGANAHQLMPLHASSGVQQQHDKAFALGIVVGSQRRACKVVGQARATQRHAPRPDAEEKRLRDRLNEFSRQRPRAGYRTACGQLRQEGLRVNPKRVQRLWREEGLKVPRKQCKRRRLGASENGSQRLKATRPNEVWSYDFVSDQTRDGRRLRFLCVVDEFTRECLALEVRRSFRGREVISFDFP